MGIIVVGVDDSETAHAAVHIAARLAATLGSGLHVVTAFDKGGGLKVDGPGGTVAVTPVDRAEGLLGRVAAELRRSVPELSTAAAQGKPAEVICDEAERVGADLIVVGNKRMHGAPRILGAVASKVATLAPCDVYIAHTT
jgi:nucleotide-binding universal stress UspA family protein